MRFPLFLVTAECAGIYFENRVCVLKRVDIFGQIYYLLVFIVSFFWSFLFLFFCLFVTSVVLS